MVLACIVLYGACFAEAENTEFRQFLDLSYRRHTRFEESLEVLESFDRAALTPEDQLSYDLYEWYLEDKLFFWPIALGDMPASDVPYADLLCHYTTTAWLPEELFAILSTEVDGNHSAVDALYTQLSINGDTMADRRAQAVAIGEERAKTTGRSVTEEMQSYVDGAQRSLSEYFTWYPSEPAIVTQVPGLSALAGFRWGSEAQGRPNQVQILPGRDGIPYVLRRTVSYHEAFPGHYVQEYNQKQLAHLPEFRERWGFSAYSEAWALYGEQLAWDVGLYENADLLHRLGFHESKLFRSAFAMADIALHAIGWDERDVEVFLMDTLGIDEREAGERIAYMRGSPAAATAAYTGCVCLTRYRERMHLALNGGFRLKDYHDLVLQIGPVPMNVLERIVGEYIESHADTQEAD